MVRGAVRKAGLVLALLTMVWLSPLAYAAPGAEEPVVHLVGPGDSLSAIAARYGTTVNAIVQANGIKNPNLIFIGQRLIILRGESPSPPQGSDIYIVQRGDTLSAIAHRLGTTISALAQANGLANPSLIYVGQRLLIPSAAPSPPEEPTPGVQIHVVQRGEYLSQIARRYGVTVSDLAEANGLANPSLIYVGQRLIIPTLTATLPPPFASVELVPSRVAQGHTLLIRVETEGDVELAGDLEGQSLTFSGQGGDYWAVVGFSPWSQPGPYRWSLVATDSRGKEVEASGLVLVVAEDFPIQYITLPPGREELLDPDLINREWAQVSAIFAQVSPEKLWQGYFQVPAAGEVSSLFGTRRSYNGGPVASYHMGVDYAAAEAAPVVAANTGRVALAQELTVRGNAVIIDHGLGVHTAYFHLSGIAVSQGQEVEKGGLIGYVGSTGLATGAHLHWELRIGKTGVNPTEWATRTIP